jgi:hypothetical protein
MNRVPPIWCAELVSEYLVVVLLKFYIAKGLSIVPRVDIWYHANKTAILTLLRMSMPHPSAIGYTMLTVP